jgi:hypothetical protein
MPVAGLSSKEIRENLISALNLDLVGPSKGHALEAEVLPQSPSRWYLTGFLAPLDAGENQRADDAPDETLDELGDSKGTDDAAPPEPPSAKRAFFPSSMGMSVLVSAEARELEVAALWGDYRRDPRPEGEESVGGPGERLPEEPEGSTGEPGNGGPDVKGSKGREAVTWRRTQREVSVRVPVSEATAKPHEVELPGSGGMKVVFAVRPISGNRVARSLVPTGTRAVSLFLVNQRRLLEDQDEVKDEAFAFQAELRVTGQAPFVPRPNLRDLDSSDWDERLADLQFREAMEFAVGHGVATRAFPGDGGACRQVWTCWIPVGEVEYVAPAPIPEVELSMETLAALPGPAEAQEALMGIVRQYRKWIEVQKTHLPTSPQSRAETGQDLINRASYAADRIEAGIQLLNDSQVLDAFKVANRTMAMAARRRMGTMQGRDPQNLAPPAWRAFQLAFLLMNIPALADPLHHDRESVDLLFFPTGGGKTEAYLGLAAFALVLRRLKNPGITSAGLCVLMRYTLRLLTLDQLSRAATLICALELERQKDPAKLGEWPFEIGLWVGMAATPNKMGHKGDNNPDSARAKTLHYTGNSSNPSPIPLENCPWCGEKFGTNSFQLKPTTDHPEELRIGCLNRRCDFSRGNSLPILAVDEPIYRRLPCFLIATVDKFAALPWTGEVGAFFGRVSRYDPKGFYGPCGPARGDAIPGPLLPPDLIIQDELHLISGPMGTMVGLYETAIDALCSREVNGQVVRPKIIASTATVRRAESQVRALFDRKLVDVFPPPGPDRRDSFFARTHRTSESNARLYVGIAAQGRSLKVVMLRAYLALLGASQKAFEAEGGKRNHDNPADPYMTLVGYFNSLRELGGARRIVEDEVRTRLTKYADRKRVGEGDGLYANRTITYEPVELTSRVSTAKVAEAKRKLALLFHEDERVDVAIATNMISVGLDIVRLGLMVVLGQPKTSAEYIQATSRVGRNPERPGLIVTLLNIHKPRDRSHYERFSAYHESFYRSVEATSVTPFSPRALDRGLAGALIGAIRQGVSELTPPTGASNLDAHRTSASALVKAFSERAKRHSGDLPQKDLDAIGRSVRDLGEDLLDSWSSIAHDLAGVGHPLQYQKEIGAASPLLHEFLSPDLQGLDQRFQKFRANRSMRDVEPNVNLHLKTLDKNATALPEDEE